MNQDLFKSPEAELVSDTIVTYEKAARWRRFIAGLIDNIICVSISLVILYFIMIHYEIPLDKEFTLLEGVFVAIGFIAVFFSVNGKLLLNRGQTIGKLILKIRILNDSGNKADFFNQILPRYMIFHFVPAIPKIGVIFNLVNLLAIFGNERKCLHDRLAGTQVVKINRT